jgi:2'-hydroxyisoflavone reductase
VRLLVLGGTRFLGRALVARALERGHDVTLFNRGRTNPDLFPEAEQLRGDRTVDLSALDGREWDAVVDVATFLPRAVALSVGALRGRVGRYVYVSSISAYADQSTPPVEEAPLAELADPGSERPEDYGALKAACERLVEEAFRERALIVRPGLIVGPHDPTDRFTYWPRRLKTGGEVLAPGDPGRRVQVVDGRDLADWIVRMVEAGATGAFNATGPEYPLTMGRMLEDCRAAAASDAELVWVGDDFLLGEEVGQWMELPLWIDGQDPEAAYFDRVAVERALGAGLQFRPLAETVRGALDEAETTDAAGLAPEREAALLAEWHGRE